MQGRKREWWREKTEREEERRGRGGEGQGRNTKQQQQNPLSFLLPPSLASQTEVANRHTTYANRQTGRSGSAHVLSFSDPQCPIRQREGRVYYHLLLSASVGQRRRSHSDNHSVLYFCGTCSYRESTLT